MDSEEIKILYNVLKVSAWRAANCNLLGEWHALLLTIWDFLGIGAGGWIGTDMLVEGAIWDPAVSDAEEVSTVIKQTKN